MRVTGRRIGASVDPPLWLALSLFSTTRATKTNQSNTSFLLLFTQILLARRRKTRARNTHHLMRIPLPGCICPRRSGCGPVRRLAAGRPPQVGPTAWEGRGKRKWANQTAMQRDNLPFLDSAFHARLKKEGISHLFNRRFSCTMERKGGETQ